MKKYIAIEEEVLMRLYDGKYVEGSLHRDKWSGVITFNAWHRKPRIRKRDRLIKLLEHGWVRESTDRIKVYESVPKELGTPRVLNILDREHEAAKEALIDREIANFV
jgi:hypothetical protein